MSNFYGTYALGFVRMLRTTYSAGTGIITVTNVTSGKRTRHTMRGLDSDHEGAAHAHMRRAYPQDDPQEPYVLLSASTARGYTFAVVRQRDFDEIDESGVFTVSRTALPHRECEHSACGQNYIDTGETKCVLEDAGTV